MNEVKCYISELGPSRHNVVLYFGYLTVPPLYSLATILAYLDKDIALNRVILHFAIILISEWLVRTFLVKQRPGFVCIEDNKLTLWYLAGILRIEYPQNRYEILPSKEGYWLRAKINKRLLPLSLKIRDYSQIYEYPPTFDFINIKSKS